MNEPFEDRLSELARQFSYPSTPAIAEKTMARLRVRPAPRPARRRLTWGFAVAIVFLAASMVVPPVRAAVLEFIRIGVVRIFPAPLPAPSLEVPRTALTKPILPVIATPAMQATSLIPFLEQLAGDSTIEQARAKIGFPIPLPTYPSDLGQPNRVFVQDTNAWMVILVWLKPTDPEQVRMSLYLIEEGSWTLDKYQPKFIQRTSVNGQPAIWALGPYPLVLRDGNVEWTRLMDGNALIWAEGRITYRLETNLSLEEAVRIAESLRAP